MKEKIFKAIKEIGGGVSFVELSTIDNFEGELDFVSGKNPNVIFWSGMSKEFIDSLVELLEEKKIKMIPTNPLVYMCDGKSMRLPIVKSKREYKKPHWLPVVFNINKSK